MTERRFVGVSTSLLNSRLGNEWPEGAFEVLARTPVRTVEYFCAEGRFEQPDHIRRVGESARANGVQVRSVHAPFGKTDISDADEAGRRASIDSVVRALDVAGELGARIVVVHGSKEPVEDAAREHRLSQCVRSLNELCKRASQRGLILALETLPRTCLGNRLAEMQWILGIVDGALNVCYDVNHVTLYEPVKETLLALGERIVTLHVSDHDGVDERHWIPGRGVTNWQAFVEGLDAIGYRDCLLHEAVDPELDLEANLLAICEAARTHLAWEP